MFRISVFDEKFSVYMLLGFFPSLRSGVVLKPQDFYRFSAYLAIFDCYNLATNSETQVFQGLTRRFRVQRIQKKRTLVKVEIRWAQVIGRWPLRALDRMLKR